MKELNKKLELILHPVRIRILTALHNRNLTPQELSDELVSVPSATLYRQLNRMLEGGLVKVAEERPVRGTVEKVYALNLEAPGLTQADLEKATREDLLQLFTLFTISSIGDFSRYLQAVEKPDFLKDGVAFTKAPLYLSDEELALLNRQIAELLLKALENKPSPERRYRFWSTIVMPSLEQTDDLPLNGKELGD
ncbi:MAG: helix-turn-helix domain-containing protein [Chloroflexi bacterium]|uniref:Helix-turn-helix domain-containing protein n=1 Tax=Candidatus Chlorohelix allophototropha TaxID=3003348 RepID=A0A8T7M283_9CHLR|nr:helix-turn-helix domain-containing protein [Chloroflexota bacterium]WJW66966.1 helix-turn-helix domain-containing protein [Chloroflexota bacterium L227-S17]